MGRSWLILFMLRVTGRLWGWDGKKGKRPIIFKALRAMVKYLAFQCIRRPLEIKDASDVV